MAIGNEPRPGDGAITDKDRAEYLHRLHVAAQHRREVRMEYEWKLAFGVWTALGAASGLAMKSDWRPPCLLVVFIWVTLISVVGVFWWWLSGILDSHEGDRMTAMRDEENLRGLLGLGDMEVPAARTLWEHHSCRTQLIVTILLSLLFALVVTARHTAPTADRTQANEVKK